MNKDDFAAKMLAECKKLGATSSEVMIGESSDISVTSRGGKLEGIERSENSGYGLRVFVGAKSATISSSKFSEMQQCAERAVSMAKAAPEDEFAALAPKQILAGEIKDLELFDENEPSPETLTTLAKTAEDTALAVKGITNSEGGDASFSQYAVTLATSNGFLKTQAASRCGVSVTALAGSGTEMQRDYDYTSARFMADMDDPEKIGRKAAELVLAKLNPRKISSGKYTVVFDPRVSKNLVGDLATGINGASIARGTSFLKSKMGEQIFAENINIVDDPHIVRGLGSRPFDGEGVANGKLKLIENGVLKTWLLDMRSANQLKLVTNGRAGRGISSLPSPSCTNFYMEKGKLSPKELMKDIKAGFYVTEAFGMGINYTTGDYSQGASGFWIENGELTYAVHEITLAGNLNDMFKNLVPANDLEFKYSINAPTVRIENLTIAGT